MPDCIFEEGFTTSYTNFTTPTNDVTPLGVGDRRGDGTSRLLSRTPNLDLLLEYCDDEEENDSIGCTCVRCVRTRENSTVIDRTVADIIEENNIVLEPDEERQLREIIEDRLQIERGEQDIAPPRFMGVVSDRNLRRQQADLVAQDKEEDDFKLVI